MSFGYFGGGRWSPWGRQPPPATPDVRDADYAYISQDDIVDPPSSYRGPSDYYGNPSGGGRRRNNQPDSDDEGPDILVLSHKGKLYQLQFPAYSISEGRLRVSEVRRRAGEKLGANPRRIKLLYKGRQLKDDAVAANEEGLKQNSEVTCIVSEAMNDPMSSSEGESASEAEMHAVDDDGRYLRAQGRSGGHRSSHSGRSRRKDDDFKTRAEARVDPSRDRERRNLEVKRDTPSAATSSGRLSPAPSASVFDASLPSAASQPLAFKQIADLVEKYRKELVIPCEKLLSNPPPDMKTRDYEVVRLTETIERDILLKTDAIDTEGRDDLRAKRKALVTEVQTMLKRLDAAKEKWKKEAS